MLKQHDYNSAYQKRVTAQATCAINKYFVLGAGLIWKNVI